MTDAELLESSAVRAERETLRDRLLDVAYLTSTPEDDRVAAVMNSWYEEALSEYERDINNGGASGEPDEPAPLGDGELRAPAEA